MECGLNSYGTGLGSVTSTCEHGNELPSSIIEKNLLTSWMIISFSRWTLLYGPN
jgi:hypothetical protein